MIHHPLEDRRIGGRTVIAAWAIVVGLVAAEALASGLAPSRPVPIPLNEPASVHAGSCGDDAATENDGNGSLHD